MIELDLLGIGADSQTLVFTDSDGERYSVQITDELRGCVRRDRPSLEVVPSLGQQTLRPRDIQSLLRAGADPQEIARNHGVEVAQVLKWSGPVEAEKEFALSRALEAPIGDEEGAPRMGDLVVDRLAARGVSSSSLIWSARREGSSPWQVCLTFIQGASEHAAHWALTSSGDVEALDQEARWLTETIAQTPSSAIFSPIPTAHPRGADDVDSAALNADLRAREALVDQLNAARGKRQEIDIESEDVTPVELPAPYPPPPHPVVLTDHEGSEQSSESISARIYSLAQARTKDAYAHSQPPVSDASSLLAEEESAKESSPSTQTSQTSEEPDEHGEDLLPGLEELAQPSDGAHHDGARKKSRRRSVPSWDEIVFGSKDE